MGAPPPPLADAPEAEPLPTPPEALALGRQLRDVCKPGSPGWHAGDALARLAMAAIAGKGWPQ
ncbi:MAG: hypothetical protein IT509_08445 [Rhodocyclaceae bacterium]|nr:hypothetical protein [Rhodocyclaceae bacterium]